MVREGFGGVELTTGRVTGIIKRCPGPKEKGQSVSPVDLYKNTFDACTRRGTRPSPTENRIRIVVFSLRLYFLAVAAQAPPNDLRPYSLLSSRVSSFIRHGRTFVTDDRSLSPYPPPSTRAAYKLFTERCFPCHHPCLR